MTNNPPHKTEIFLWLALRHSVAKNAWRAGAEDSDDARASSDRSCAAQMPAFFDWLDETDARRFKSLLTDYDAKTAAEKEDWANRIRRAIKTDAEFLDENLHWSHIAEALKKELPAIRRIIFDALPETDKNRLKSALSLDEGEPQASENGRREKFRFIEQTVRKAFADQFINLRDLPQPTWFDSLDGAQTVRLIRLAGIREVTFACARIEAVETVAAFLKRFPAEAARAIAAQLSNLPKTSDERLLFAENLVRHALETEPQPTAMLDLLGMRLIGIGICQSPKNRLVYAQQKLPKEFAPELSEIIETARQQTPPGLQKEISAEIEQLAETILKTAKS